MKETLAQVLKRNRSKRPKKSPTYVPYTKISLGGEIEELKDIKTELLALAEDGLDYSFTKSQREKIVERYAEGKLRHKDFVTQQAIACYLGVHVNTIRAFLGRDKVRKVSARIVQDARIAKRTRAQVDGKN